MSRGNMRNHDGNGLEPEVASLLEKFSNTNAASPYRYRELSADPTRPMIRLIEVQPIAAGTFCPELNIIHVPLAASPNYDAVSYCWGSQKPTMRILCNGRQLRITDNAWTAIMFLRHPHKVRRLWIDAVCIDQSNDEEKSRQVDLMHAIYRRAQSVQVWLGEASDDSDGAMELVPLIQDGYMLGYIMPDSARMTDLSLPAQMLFHSFFRLIERPWFSRIWVIQEVAARGGEEVIVHCGSRTVPWRELVAAATCVSSHQIRFPQANFQTLARLRAFRAACDGSLPETAQTLFASLVRHRRFDSTDPRDKLFALYGLASDVGPRKLDLKANYSLRVDKLYKRIARAMLEHSGSLDLFGFPRPCAESAVSFQATVDGQSKILTLPLPTWVPNWSVWDNETVMLRRDSFTGDVRCHFNAALASRAEPTFTDSENCLELSGFTFDTIDDIGYIWEAGAYTAHKSLLGRVIAGLSSGPVTAYAMLDRQRRTRVWHRKRYVGGGDMLDAFWRTLVLDQYGSSDGKANFLEWNRFFRWYRPLHLLYIDRVWPVYCLLLLIVASIQGLTVPRRSNTVAFRSCASTLTNRRMFCTGKGYIGLAPKLTRIGDRIAIFKGGCVPLVIRQCGTRWELIGESYVHGIMQGEAFAERKCKRMQIV